MTTEDIIRSRLEDAVRLRALVAESVLGGERLIAEAERHERTALALAWGQEVEP